MTATRFQFFARPALIAAVKAHARANYNTGGWDYVVECWSDDEIAVAILGCHTPEAAIAEVAKTAGVLNDYRDDIRGA